jgi:hypothetical protein
MMSLGLLDALTSSLLVTAGLDPAITPDSGCTEGLDGRLRGGHDEVGSGHLVIRRIET